MFLFPVGLESRLCPVAVFSVQYGAYPLRDGSLFMQREIGGGGVRGGEGNKKGGVKAISDYQDWGAKLSYKEV